MVEAVADFPGARESKPKFRALGRNLGQRIREPFPNARLVSNFLHIMALPDDYSGTFNIFHWWSDDTTGAQALYDIYWDVTVRGWGKPSDSVEGRVLPPSEYMAMEDKAIKRLPMAPTPSLLGALRTCPNHDVKLIHRLVYAKLL